MVHKSTWLSYWMKQATGSAYLGRKMGGESIAIGLRGHDRPRPLTYKFMANLLKRLDVVRGGAA